MYVIHGIRYNVASLEWKITERRFINIDASNSVTFPYSKHIMHVDGDVRLAIYNTDCIQLNGIQGAVGNGLPDREPYYDSLMSRNTKELSVPTPHWDRFVRDIDRKKRELGYSRLLHLCVTRSCILFHPSCNLNRVSLKCSSTTFENQ